MYVWNFLCVCMNLIEMCCWFNNHFGSSIHLPPNLWCIFVHVFPSNTCVSRGFQGAHLFHFPCVRTLHAPSLAWCAGHTLATNKDILLSFARNHVQGNTLQPTTGNPTPNGLRYIWYFLQGRSLDMLVGSIPSTPSYFSLKTCNLVCDYWRDYNKKKLISHRKRHTKWYFVAPTL